jgi:hypothetical protein
MAGWTVVAVLVLTSLSCQAAMGAFNPAGEPAATPTSTLLATQEESLPTSDMPSPTPGETATASPPGTVVNVTGVVQEIRIENNVHIIVINGVEYRVPPEILVIILQHLRVGVPIVFVGRVDVSGVIIIINVFKIDNVIIVINPPEKKHNGDDDEDEDEDD